MRPEDTSIAVSLLQSRSEATACVGEGFLPKGRDLHWEGEPGPVPPQQSKHRKVPSVCGLSGCSTDQIKWDRGGPRAAGAQLEQLQRDVQHCDGIEKAWEGCRKAEVSPSGEAQGLAAGDETGVTPGLAQAGVPYGVQPGVGSAWGSGAGISDV